jgi:hypothetical protein
MLLRSYVAVCSENHTEHINTFCGQNSWYLTVNEDGMYYELLPLFLVSRAKNKKKRSCKEEYPASAVTVFCSGYISEPYFLKA